MLTPRFVTGKDVDSIKTGKAPQMVGGQSVEGEGRIMVENSCLVPVRPFIGLRVHKK